VSEHPMAILSSTLRERISATLLDLEQRGILTRKHVQYATGLEVSQVRRVFIGEHPLSLAAYVAIQDDPEIDPVAKSALRSCVHVDAHNDSVPVRHVAACVDKAITNAAYAIDYLETLRLATSDNIVTPDECAAVRTASARMRAKLDEIDANMESHASTAARGPRSVAG
jgi:hypothetical protein